MATGYNRIAGQSVERLAALSDGIFAFAMTLLVLDLHVPVSEAVHNESDLWRGLTALAPRLLMYMMSFLTLGIFWNGQQAQLNHLYCSTSASRGSTSRSFFCDHHSFFHRATGRVHRLPARAHRVLAQYRFPRRHALSQLGDAQRALASSKTTSRPSSGRRLSPYRDCPGVICFRRGALCHQHPLEHRIYCHRAALLCSGAACSQDKIG